MTITTVAFDGDDTLWHHENYFNQAKDQFHVAMNAIGSFPDAADQVDAKHIDDLKIWGYGVKGFTLTMIELAIALTDGKITGTQLQTIFDIGKQLYLHPVRLLDHVAETIGTLKGRYFLMLITKGDLVAQEMKITQSGLADFFDGIEIVSEKDENTYRRIFNKYHINSKEFIMIGNSTRSDILPPLKLGAQAIHIPYQTSWHHEDPGLKPEEMQNFIVLPSMKDLAATLDDLNKQKAII